MFWLFTKACLLYKTSRIGFFFTIYFHDLWHGNTGGYMGLQRVNGIYKGLRGVIRGDRGLQGVTWGYKVCQGVTRGDRGFQGVTRG